MDGLSAAASVIAVIQISGTLFNLYRAYYLEVKDARKDIQRLQDEVTSLHDVLTDLSHLSDDYSAIWTKLNKQDGPVHQCQRDLLVLVEELEPSQGKNEMKHIRKRALKWSFKSKNVEKHLTAIGRHKATFNLALTGDLVGLTQALEGKVQGLSNGIAILSDGVAELQIGQRAFIADARQQKIREWLSPPDPSSNYNTACKKRQSTTGEWLINSDNFAKWKTAVWLIV